MAVTVQTQFESVVTEMYEEAFVGSSIENGTTLIKFDRNQEQELMIRVNGSPSIITGQKVHQYHRCESEPRAPVQNQLSASTLS